MPLDLPQEKKITNGDDYVAPCSDGQCTIGGLTKREHFSALAMQGILSGLPTNKQITPQLLATESIMCADALILELNKIK